MDFDDLVVKDNPGLCRCCLSEGCYKDLSTEYTWMNDTEVYADMLLECFDISISQHNDGPNGSSRLICEVCITRLRDACNFKKQVLDSETRFIDMLAKGEFQSRVLVYQPMKAENQEVEEATAEENDGEVEYLDEEMEYDEEDDLPLRPPQQAEGEPSSSNTATLTIIKGKRGRPRKDLTPVKSEKKPKLEEKSRTAKGRKKQTKGEPKNFSRRLLAIRRNIKLILHYGNAIPFTWYTRGFKCFYCQKTMRDCDSLKEHTILKHSNINLDQIIPLRVRTKDVPIKIDITNLSCKVCPEEMQSLDELTQHIVKIHGEEYNSSTEVCAFPFYLQREAMQCCICPEILDNITCMVTHMYKYHASHEFICQICGLGFLDRSRMQRHITKSHVKHKCHICEKTFEAFHKLEKHKQRFHAQAKAFYCNLCSAKFESNYQVRVHMGKTHNVEKYRIKCELCDKVTSTKGAMLLHLQAVHSENKYKCDLCDYECGIKWMIKLHQRKHFGEKDYVCSICQRKFGRSSNLRAHMKVHTGAVGRVCRQCKQGFVDQETLKRHEFETHFYNEQ